MATSKSYSTTLPSTTTQVGATTSTEFDGYVKSSATTSSAALRSGAGMWVGSKKPKPPPPVALFDDVIVSEIGWQVEGDTTPGVQEGEYVLFWVKVKNIGTLATPAGMITDVGVYVDDNTVAWCDLYMSSIAPGEVVKLFVNGGPADLPDVPLWRAVKGTHKVSAQVNSMRRYDEPFENNWYDVTMTVEAAVVPPPPPPPPPVVTTGRQPNIGWAGVLDTDQMIDNGNLLAKMKPAMQGWVYIMSDVPNPVPDWMISEMKMMGSVLGSVYPGMYAAKLMLDTNYASSAAHALAAACVKVGAKGWALDMEPYLPVNHFLYSDGSLTRAQAKAVGLAVGAILAPLGEGIIYTSSDGSFKGSYFDLIQQSIGNFGTYDNSVAEDFYDGLRQAGAKFTITDASFHWGVQLRGDDWSTGVAHSVALTVARFPGEHASVMLWPDNDESHGPFDAATIQYALENATRQSNGPVVTYQHTLSSNGPTWDAWLAAEAAAMATPIH